MSRPMQGFKGAGSCEAGTNRGPQRSRAQPCRVLNTLTLEPDANSAPDGCALDRCGPRFVPASQDPAPLKPCIGRDIQHSAPQASIQKVPADDDSAILPAALDELCGWTLALSTPPCVLNITGEQWRARERVHAVRNPLDQW